MKYAEKPPPCRDGFFDFCLLQKLGLEHEQQETCGNSGTDNTGYVGAHGVHQQEVGGVVLTTLTQRNTGRPRTGRTAGTPDQTLDLAAPEHAQ